MQRSPDDFQMSSAIVIQVGQIRGLQARTTKWISSQGYYAAHQQPKTLPWKSNKQQESQCDGNSDDQPLADVTVKSDRKEGECNNDESTEYQLADPPEFHTA